jgi:hypothetical protein
MLNRIDDSLATTCSSGVTQCPYLCGNGTTCLAASSTLTIPSEKFHEVCYSEDFDDCALFLSRFLRRNPPLYGFSPCTMRDK